MSRGRITNMSSTASGDVQNDEIEALEERVDRLEEQLKERDRDLSDYIMSLRDRVDELERQQTTTSTHRRVWGLIRKSL